MIHLHNSLSRTVEKFVPRDPEHVTMYVCGPTVYDTPHVGNARPAVIFDVLYRVLRHTFPKVSYARNFTDIDDKIIERAAMRQETIEALTDRTIDQYHEITSELRILRPNFEPRATAYIDQMQAMIAQLLQTGHAYEAENHVLFDVAGHPEHGKLSRHEQENLDAGNRVEVASYKRSPGDFVLWKPSNEHQPGWESPWGRGRPGWHIECSAMIEAIFGQTIDIHGGGGDLRFPHHDCEISQSECAHDRPLANYWLHNGMLRINRSKMAKSLGNVLTPRELLDEGVPGEAIRLALLSAHYRSPLDWEDETTLPQAEQALHKWTNALLPFKGRFAPTFNSYAQPILDVLQNDLNTPGAIAHMHDLAGQVNKDPNDEMVAGMLYGARLLGVLHDLTEAEVGVDPAIQTLVDARNAARADKDFALADKLRDDLFAQGIQLRDTKGETVWWRT